MNISFKEWLDTHEMRKPYQDYMAKTFPDMPPAVRHELGTNHVIPNLKKMAAGRTGKGLNQNSPELIARQQALQGGNDETIAASNSPTTKALYGSTEEMMNKNQKIQIFQSANWKEEPEQVTLRFDQLSEKTRTTMWHYRFGLETNVPVKRHNQRMQDQQKLMQQKSVDQMEPVIMIRNQDGTYELLEGWHRTFNFFLNTMTEDQKAALTNQSISSYDLPSHISLPNPITILAYVGTPKTQTQASTGASQTDYQTSTVDMPQQQPQQPQQTVTMPYAQQTA